MPGYLPVRQEQWYRRETTGVSTPASASVAMAIANQEYSWQLPVDVEMVAWSTGAAGAAFRWSLTTGVVAGGGGIPVGAAGYGSFSFLYSTSGITLYFSSGNAGQTMYIEYFRRVVP